VNNVLQKTAHELKAHAPFTLLGTLTGVAVMIVILFARVPHGISEHLFHVCHPAHVLLSAAATAGMYRLYGKGSWVATILVGYAGAIGIGTLSDCLMPFVGEYMLDLPHRHVHIGFIEDWFLVNPAAVIGIVVGMYWPKTKFSHAGHVLISTWASLFHITMALGDNFDLITILMIAPFLFLAVWIPCCTSDIIFPLVLSQEPPRCCHSH
jgi:hypothetical protein